MPKNVLTDAEVKLTGYLSEKKYPESFRLIRYYDEEDDREFTFLTNAKQLSAECCPHTNQCGHYHLLSRGYCPT